MRKGALIASAVFAIAGAILAGISTNQHFHLRRHGFEETSFCAISEKINCDIVNGSSYSELAGVPVAWWGLVFYVAVVGISTLAAFSRKNWRASVAIAWLMSIGGIIFSAYLAYMAIAVLGVVCIECLGMYIVNVALVISLFAALKIPIRGLTRFIIDYVKAFFGCPSNLNFSPRPIVHIVTLGILFLVGFVAIKAIEAKQSNSSDKKDTGSVSEKINAFYQQSLYSIEPDANWSVWGNPNAKVTIIEFSDFQCPFCRVAAFNIKPYLQEFKDDVRFYFVNYPLDSNCNDGIDKPMHPYACFAAKATVCASKEGKFWQFHDELFRNQQKLDEDVILELSEKMGWDRQEFKACVDSPETDARVRSDVASGRKIYVSGTPTIFLDKRKLKYWRDPDFLHKIIREEIKRSK